LLGTDRRRAIQARKGTQKMKVKEMLAALRYERQRLDEAIICLERIDYVRDNLKKLGRPLGRKNKPKIMPLALVN
jgi:hypothetical protein